MNRLVKQHLSWGIRCASLNPLLVRCRHTVYLTFTTVLQLERNPEVAFMCATGLLMATGALLSNASAPIMHLCDVNPYVSAALQDWQKSARLSARVPLQPASGLLASSHSDQGSTNGLAGTSSFGMSGVNSHVLLSRPASGQLPVGPAQRQAFARARCWTGPPPHPLLQFASPAQEEILVQAAIARTNLAYLLDHQVPHRYSFCLTILHRSFIQCSFRVHADCLRG